MKKRLDTAMYAAAIAAAVVLMVVVSGPTSSVDTTSVLSAQNFNSGNLKTNLRQQLETQQEWLDQVQSNAPVVELSNSDFANGTVVVADEYVLVSDGDSSRRIPLTEGEVVIKLTEDVIFNPNASNGQLAPHRSGYVRPEQYQFYNPQAYGIGFFAAIAIERDGVVLDLGGNSLSQSREHALQQRFYANIELADQPFIPDQGPADFGSELNPGRQVAVVNGHVGRASHHGIHGQMSEDVLIQDLTFEDFEVASISLHGSRNVSVNRVNVLRNSNEVEVLGIYSALRFIQPYLAALPEGYTLDLADDSVSKEQLQARLAAINDDVINESDTWRKDHPYIVNQSGIVDGNAYGLVINAKGVAVNGFPDKFTAESAAQNIYINDTQINNIKVSINEIPALSVGDDQLSGAQGDVVGAIFQTLGFIGSEGEYTGNMEDSPIQLAQAIVSKAIHDGVDFGFLPVDKNTISPKTVSWVEGDLKFDQTGARYVLNGDSMHHVNKGLTAVKMDGSQNVLIDNLYASNINNLSLACLSYSDFANYLPLTELEKAYDRGASNSVKGSTQPGAGMNSARGISLASSRKVVVLDSDINNVNSNNGPSFGAEVIYESDAMDLTGLEVDGLAPNNASFPADTYKSTPIRINTTNSSATILN